MRLTTILCQLTGAFAGFLPTVRDLTAVGPRLVLALSESQVVSCHP